MYFNLFKDNLVLLVYQLPLRWDLYLILSWFLVYLFLSLFHFHIEIQTKFINIFLLFLVGIFTLKFHNVKLDYLNNLIIIMIFLFVIYFLLLIIKVYLAHFIVFQHNFSKDLSFLPYVFKQTYNTTFLSKIISSAIQLQEKYHSSFSIFFMNFSYLKTF